ncbi:MAG: OmpA family protein [Leptolyngbyaceae cyanobacterium SM1_3_5]|nr:OmpA family protein [Leptolyngbyaceae cyanobacterium SM1_3_5]
MGVTLPIDALFAGESLRPESQILLNTVVGELQRYPNSAVLVAAHSDAGENAAQARARSFAQAQAIVRSLEATLGDSYHWVAVGYGQTEPIAPNDTAANRQRNRRIEIGIFPASEAYFE